MLYASDARWWTQYGGEVERSFTGESWTCAERLRCVINWVEAVDEAGLSTKPGRIHTGLNSGYQAINLAFMWGAARIILLGYDMQRGPSGESHHHGDHEGGLPNLGTMPEWTRRMVQLGADLRARGVEVVNATRRTAITCFERLPIERALDTDRPSILVRGMLGLGDNIYQRAVLRELARTHEVWLMTPWPQLYDDLPVRCVRPETKLRTQARNVAQWASWAMPPRGLPEQRITYAGRDGTMLEALCAALGVKADRLIFDLPASVRGKARLPYIVIRPATVRAEWPAAARNPLPEYLALAAEVLRKDFHIISVADLASGAEWPVLPLPCADETFHAGELGIDELLGLVAGAAGVVGGVGWLVPAAVACRVPMFLIYGGWGKDNGPTRIFDKRMHTDLVEQAIPDRFCMCSRHNHACDKRITHIGGQLDRWALGLTARRAPAMVA